MTLKLKDTLTPIEIRELQNLMRKEPLWCKDILEMDAANSLRRKGYVAFGVGGWTVNWPKIARYEYSKSVDVP